MLVDATNTSLEQAKNVNDKFDSLCISLCRGFALEASKMKKVSVLIMCHTRKV